jgi:hypothetical protein
MGRVLYCQGFFEKSLVFYKKSNEVAHAINRNKTLGFNYLGMALISRQQKDCITARKHANAAKELLN